MLDYSKKLKTLKKLGLVNYSSAAKLSSAQKSVITRTFNKYAGEIDSLKQFLASPSEFAIRKVSKDTARMMEKSGYIAMPKNPLKMIVPKFEYDQVHISKNKIKYSKAGKTETIYLVGDPVKLFTKANQLAKNLPRNQLLSFKIDGAHWSSRHFISLQEMIDYLTNVLLPRFGNEPDKFWPKISIVTIEGIPEWMKKENAKKAPKNKRGK